MHRRVDLSHQALTIDWFVQDIRYAASDRLSLVKSTFGLPLPGKGDRDDQFTIVKSPRSQNLLHLFEQDAGNHWKSLEVEDTGTHRVLVKSERSSGVVMMACAVSACKGVLGR